MAATPISVKDDVQNDLDKRKSRWPLVLRKKRPVDKARPIFEAIEAKNIFGSVAKGNSNKH